MKKIGMIVPTLDNSFFSELAFRVQKALGERNAATYVVSTNNNAETELEYLNEFRKAGMDGVISVSALQEINKDVIGDLPLVWIDRIPASDHEIPYVANDDCHAMELATECLINKGCRNILFMTGFVKDSQNNPRLEGYRKALEAHGIEYDPRYVMKREGKRPTEEETGGLAVFAIKNGLKADGIITSSERAAFGATRALQKIGYFVPEDIRLICFDNSPFAAMTSPSLTTLDRKPERMAEIASDLILAKADGRHDISVKNTVTVELIERGSTR